MAPSAIHSAPSNAGGRFESIVMRRPLTAHFGLEPGSIGPGLDPPWAAWLATAPTVHLWRAHFHDYRVRPGAGRRAIRFAGRRVPRPRRVPGGLVPGRMGADLPPRPPRWERPPADHRAGPRAIGGGRSPHPGRGGGPPHTGA